MFPEHTFHIFGDHETLIRRENIIWYGYTDFGEIIPYIRYADIGLHCITNVNGNAIVMGDSLKVQQYSYFNLPIVAPECIVSGRSNFFKYDQGDEKSIAKAIEGSILYAGNVSGLVADWDDLALAYLNLLNDNRLRCIGS